MNAAVATSFDAQLARLAAVHNESAAGLSPEVGFVSFVFHAVGEMWPSALRLPDVHGISLDHSDRSPWLATVGYVCHCGLSDSADLVAAWRAGIARLMQRDAFPADRASFVYRPVELLGICLGAKMCEPESSPPVDWLRGVLKEYQRKVPANHTWERHCGSLAAEFLQAPWPPYRLPRVEDLSLEDLGLFLLVANVGRIAGDAKEIMTAQACAALRVLDLAIEYQPTSGDVAAAGLVYRTIRSCYQQFIHSAHAKHWQLGSPHRDAAALVQNIFRSFPRVAHQLLKRHDGRRTLEIKDEYDVQDLLHALLHLFFDDIRPEEWTPSYAGRSTRADFLLKKERIIVEAKMTRANLKQKQVVEQLIVDRAHYSVHPDCDLLLCFVYDPKRLLDNPAALENDLSSDESKPRMLVIASS
jgi:REase_DpnII-MboI